MAAPVVLVVLAALLALATSRLWSYAVVRLAWRPRAMARRFREQGVHGPSYRFLTGSNEDVRRMKAEADGVELDLRDHDYLPRIVPHLVKWKHQYGSPYVYWFGPQPRICIFDYELVKQVLANKYGHFIKNDTHPTILAMIGKGLVLVDGSDWVRHRRVVNPAFAMDKLKMMTGTMVSCAECLIKKWEDQATYSKSREIEVEFSKESQELTADVISCTAFGSSFMEGKEVFHAQKQLQAITVATMLNVQIPGFKYLPTKQNRCKWMLENKLKNTLSRIIQCRVASKESGFGNDLLGVMLEACFTKEQGGKKGEQILSVDEIIDECKTFFFAGHETTSHLLTWTMFLLSVYPEWQERLREEVLRECGKGNPNADMLSKLKEMTMVLLETLRLYSPIIFMLRKPISDMKLGNLNLPKGSAIVIPIPMLHRDKEVWGDRANEFDPMRFENGITKAAKIPHALLGFSIGPRSCIGQNFAMLEAKSVLAMILQKFSFTLSPKYVHAPADLLTLQPKSGLPIILSPLDA
ncbi:cytochrome P450 709B2 [Brachypodium distachyon]|uniref:cytochrome P450 709B2 n=1 Tax=Brachypodium distachyon TaxID=15368 RepID=UPI0001C7641E|nr:cytochrome P450 709B2 [Brachypodium distachyon]|eukprot:XP_003557875.1 cytochrome P450 709B2 [Brachypodium distachyon]